MDFDLLKEKMTKHFIEMSKDSEFLFELNINKDYIWELYLSSFPEGTNEIYRERTEYDCNCCKQFIRNFGGVVSIKNNQRISIWDFEAGEYQVVVDALKKYTDTLDIQGIYISDRNKIGTDRNKELMEDTVIEYSHFYIELPNKFVYSGRDTIDTYKGNIKSRFDVFYRSLKEISIDTTSTVLELINQGSLYRGEEWENILLEFITRQNEFKKLNEEQGILYCWDTSTKSNDIIGKIRNHSIGKLLIDIENGVDLNSAVSSFENIVAPQNYKRPKPIFTSKMLEDAKKTLQEEGYLDSLPRKFASVEDITVNNILFADRSIPSLNNDIFSEMSKQTTKKQLSFDKVEEVSIQDFIDKILPTTSKIEMYMESRHKKNLCSLITSTNKDSKSMFKWDNNFSWAYNGNVTDSMLKENVSKAGGKVDGVLRFSIQWNDIEQDSNDLDAHCIEPDKNRIYFGNERSKNTGGILDVDIQNPGGKVAVENITWSIKSKMIEGNYEFLVDCYANRCKGHGFRAEIEFDGTIYTYNYERPVRQSEKVRVATVTLKNGIFNIIHHLPESSITSQNIWGVQTNEFTPVNVMMYSPNFWNGNSVGNKHFMFMLDGCTNPDQPNGFFNEFINNDLNKHKKVFEAMSSTIKVEPSEKQLTGLSFSSTIRESVVVRITGKTKRVLKIKF